MVSITIASGAGRILVTRWSAFKNAKGSSGVQDKSFWIVNFLTPSFIFLAFYTACCCTEANLVYHEALPPRRVFCLHSHYHFWIVVDEMLAMFCNPTIHRMACLCWDIGVRCGLYLHSNIKQYFARLVLVFVVSCVVGAEVFVVLVMSLFSFFHFWRFAGSN